MLLPMQRKLCRSGSSLTQNLFPTRENTYGVTHDRGSVITLGA